MNSLWLIVILLVYLAGLFIIAYYAEKKAHSKWVKNPYVYALSIAVYCSAWTYYGSVGMASRSGIEFLTIYLGPVIIAPLWILILRKVLRITKQHNVTSIADFISLRYAKNRSLGALVAMICLLGTIPYISLQLKAISDSFGVMIGDFGVKKESIFADYTLYIALILAVFATFFGTRNSDTATKHPGIIATVAIESVLKLVFFLVVGIFVTFFLFDGTTDIYQQASALPGFHESNSFGGVSNSYNWLFLIILSMMSIFLLPRQFQVTVLENVRENHLKKAIWLFPLYLLLFNLFVIYIAWAGKITFGDTVNADYYSILLPLENGNTFLALLVMLGGFSAVISMVIVSTLALSTMVSNSIIIPYGFLDRFSKSNPEKNLVYIKIIRRVAIFFIIALAYFFFHIFSNDFPLISIGLMAFIMVAQLAPSFFLGLYWNRGTSRASKVGIIVGAIITIYTFILPAVITSITGSDSFVSNGPLGIDLLKPHALFGLDILDPAAHTFFWSLFFNTIIYISLSIATKGNYRERNYAEMFVNSKMSNAMQDNAFVWKGEAYVEDIKRVMSRILGLKKTEQAMNYFFDKYEIAPDTQLADARLINFSERLLSGTIGGSSAKILIASVVKEDEISLVEVLEILEETKSTMASNKELREKSRELSILAEKLKIANDELKLKDKQKDEFLDIVAHELKTPITGIRAAAEIIIEDQDEIPAEIQQKFLSNILQDSDRLARLINNILDFEKLSTGRISLTTTPSNFNSLIKKAVENIQVLTNQKKINLTVMNDETEVIIDVDEDRMLQVLINLLSNAIKFTDRAEGKILIQTQLLKDKLFFSITDNGIGVPAEDIDYIFDKFYQSKSQQDVKHSGSGFGLAICKQIIELHSGEIWYDRDYSEGARIKFSIPITQ